MKTLACAVAAGVLVAAPLAAPAPATADTPGCVSRHEYRIVNNNPSGPYTFRTKGQAERLFDTKGQVFRKRENMRWKLYPACPGAHTATHVCVRYYHAGRWFLHQRHRCASH